MQPVRPDITPEILNLIAEIDEFKGGWRVYQNLARNAWQHYAMWQQWKVLPPPPASKA